MRILTLVDSLAVGGAERSLATTAPHLIDRGVDMHVAYLVDRPGVGRDLAEAGAVLHSLEGPGGRLGALLRATRLIREVHPDLVHTVLFEADIAGRVAARLAGIPVVSSFVSEPYGPEHVNNPEYRAWKVRGAQIADALSARLVTRFHAVSTNAANLMSERLRVPREKIDVIPRGRDPRVLGQTSEERRTSARASLGFDDATPIVLSVGRHRHVKGLDVLIDAFSIVAGRVPDAILLIVGREGPATRDLEKLIAKHGLEGSVVLAGFRPDVPDLMCAADVFAFASRSEGSPGVLLEAMALGCPIVVSDILSAREVAGVSPQTMILSPVDDPQAMAGSIVELLADGDQSRHLAKVALERFMECYTIDVVADETLSFYERCLDRS
jgi:glycosyltransferase involved in cell wall biosynthesis